MANSLPFTTPPSSVVSGRTATPALSNNDRNCDTLVGLLGDEEILSGALHSLVTRHSTQGTLALPQHLCANVCRYLLPVFAPHQPSPPSPPPSPLRNAPPRRHERPGKHASVFWKAIKALPAHYFTLSPDMQRALALPPERLFNDQSVAWGPADRAAPTKAIALFSYRTRALKHSQTEMLRRIAVALALRRLFDSMGPLRGRHDQPARRTATHLLEDHIEAFYETHFLDDDSQPVYRGSVSKHDVISWLKTERRVAECYAWLIESLCWGALVWIVPAVTERQLVNGLAKTTAAAQAGVRALLGLGLRENEEVQWVGERLQALVDYVLNN